MIDPLKDYYRKFGFDKADIKKLVWGEKYTCVLLNEGQIGVCANLEHTIHGSEIYNEDLSNRTFRIVYNAYLNAKFNYQNSYDEDIDIFQAIDFKQASNIVMIGFFGPLYQKFEAEGINLKVFDKFKVNDRIEEISKIEEALAKAKSVILTATSISNSTFDHIISATQKANIYLLGPSCLLHNNMYQYKNIKTLFGTIFELNDMRILEIIEKGGGSREFLKFGRKVQL